MDISAIQKIIDEKKKTATGDLGVFFKDLKTGQTAGTGEGEKYPSASVFKLFVLAELVRQIQEGKCSFEDRYVMKDSDKSIGSGLLQYLGEGINLSLKDYATLMMIISDNTAADFLLNFTGRENIIENVIRPLGLSCTKVDLTCKALCAIDYLIPPDTPFEKAEELAAVNANKLRNTEPYLCTMELDDITSPLDSAKVLELMYRNEWVNAQASTDALDIMKLCQTNGRIPRFLPEGTVVAHKTGTMDRVANDAGIVYTPAGDYILTMFYNGNKASQEEYDANDGTFSEDLLAHISEEIYKEYVK